MSLEGTGLVRVSSHYGGKTRLSSASIAVRLLAMCITTHSSSRWHRGPSHVRGCMYRHSDIYQLDKACRSLSCASPSADKPAYRSSFVRWKYVLRLCLPGHLLISLLSLSLPRCGADGCTGYHVGTACLELEADTDLCLRTEYQKLCRTWKAGTRLNLADSTLRQ